VAKTRQPTDTLFTWDCRGDFWFVTKMRSPSRYLCAEYIGLITLNSPVTAAKIRARIFNDLERQPPSFVVDKTTNPTGRLADDMDYRWFQSFLDHNHYRLAFSENSLRIYALVPDKLR